MGSLSSSSLAENLVRFLSGLALKRRGEAEDRGDEGLDGKEMQYGGIFCCHENAGRKRVEAMRVQRVMMWNALGGG